MDSAQVDMGVAVVAFQSADFIRGCLDSLFASAGVRLRVVVVDNASDDATVEAIRSWAQVHGGLTFAEAAAGELACAEADLTLLRAPVNGGFAYATNRALEVLRADPALDLFWLLNPDCQVLPDTAARFVAAGSDGAFGLMGGRVVYLSRPDLVQTDGGRVSRVTGVVSSVNSGLAAAAARVPDGSEIDFISGASCVASRRFLNTVGLMREDYFLYYEEVDWALRRGPLPLRQVPEAVVLHHGGMTIGSGGLDRRASAFSNYFNFRNRLRFMRRFAPLRLPLALGYGLGKAAQLAAQGAFGEAHAVLAGVMGMGPPSKVRDRLSPAAQAIAFASRGGAP